jgi:hypothetical protein
LIHVDPHLIKRPAPKGAGRLAFTRSNPGEFADYFEKSVAFGHARL